MKQIILLSILLLSHSVLAAEDCKPIYQSTPVSFSVSAKKDGNTHYSNRNVVTGNKLSPIQPAEKLNYVVGTFNFSLTPISSCTEGVLIDFDSLASKKQSLIPWCKPIVLDGKDDSDFFIKVTAVRVKP